MTSNVILQRPLTCSAANRLPLDQWKGREGLFHREGRRSLSSFRLFVRSLPVHVSPGTPSWRVWTFIAESYFADKPAVVGEEKKLCEHDLRTQGTPVRRFDPSLQVKCWNFAPIRFTFRANLNASAIHRRCVGNPLEQVVKCCCNRQAGRRDMRTRLK